MLDWTRPRPAVTVTHLLAVGHAFGVPAERLLADTDLSVEAVQTLGRQVMGLEEVAVVRALLRELPRVEHLGILSAADSHTTVYGAVGFAWTSAPTMRHVYASGRHFHALTFGMTDIDFRIDETSFTKMFIPGTLPADVHEFYLQRELCLPLVVAREITESPVVARARLAQPAFRDPESLRAARDFFGADPTFDAEVACFTLPLDFLDRPLPRRNADTHAQMTALAEIEKERVLASTKVSEIVRRDVLAHLSEGASLDETARRLLMSPRTLRRHLQDEGTTYRTIVESVRVSRAELLLTGSLSVTQAASELGYENPSAFTTAFKRWHGMTPTQYRAERQPLD